MENFPFYLGKPSNIVGGHKWLEMHRNKIGGCDQPYPCGWMQWSSEGAISFCYLLMNGFSSGWGQSFDENNIELIQVGERIMEMMQNSLGLREISWWPPACHYNECWTEPTTCELPSSEFISFLGLGVLFRNASWNATRKVTAIGCDEKCLLEFLRVYKGS